MDVGVRGLEAKGEILRDREDFTKRAKESDEEYGQYLKDARKQALDPTKVPKMILKTCVVAYLTLRLARRILEKFLPEATANQVLKVVGLILVLWKIRAPSKVNPQLKSVVPSYPIIGSVIELMKNQKDIHSFTYRTLQKTGFQSTEVMIPGVHMMYLMDPRDREHVMRGHFTNYVKNLPEELNSFAVAMAELFGRGIFAVDGSEWKDHRKIASHLFSSNALKMKMEKVFNHHADIFKSVLIKHAEANEVIDLQNHLQAIIFDAFCEIAFGHSPGAFELAVKGEKLDFLVSFDFIQMYTMERFFQPPLIWTMLRFFNLGTEREIQKHTQVMKDYIMPIVRARLQDGDTSNGDMLSLYIDHAKELNQSYMLDEEYLLDVVAAFMVAGRDTTSCSLTNFFRFLATNPKAEETLLEEIKQHKPADGYTTLEITREMNYASSGVNEALRLLPPVSADFRYCAEDEVLPSGLKVKRGMQVFMSNLAIGHDPNLWKNPEEFLPERWMGLANNVGGVRRPEEFMFPVFWGGPRLCLGHAMARFEMITFISKICPELRITPLPGQKYDIVTGPVAFYHEGMLVRVEKRA